MHPLLGLMFWGAVGGYFIGKRKGQGGLYALLGIPASVVFYVLIMASVSLV